MPVQIVTAPVVEPVSLAEAKDHLRVRISDDDALISALIIAARQAAETITRRAIAQQQWKIVGDRFPSPMAGRLTEYWLGQQWGLSGMNSQSVFLPTGRTGYELILPFPPVQTVDSIKYIDTYGVQQTLPAINYLVDNVSEPARVAPAYGYAWPTTQQRINAVEVTFTAGYSAGQIPEGIKAWIKIRIGSLYENREEVALLNRGHITELPFVDGLLDPFRVITFN